VELGLKEVKNHVGKPPPVEVIRYSLVFISYVIDIMHTVMQV
jgi:hypothetical protein